MKDIRSILEIRLSDVTIRTSQATANCFTEWVGQNIVPPPPDLLSVAWDVWDAATSETESALAVAFDKAQTWLAGRPLTTELEDGFYTAFTDHLHEVDFDNWAVLNTRDLEWFDADNIAIWNEGLGPEGSTETLPDLHLGRPYESGPVGPATHRRSYQFAELPIGAVLAWLAADAGVDLPRNADYAAIYDLVVRAVASAGQTVAGETDDELTWPGLYSLIIDAYAGESPDHTASLIHQLQQAAAAD